MEDNRRTPNSAQIKYFKERAAAWLKNTSAAGKKGAADDMDYYLRQYQGLEQYDTRTTGKIMTDKKSNYIEIKVGGVTIRKQADKMTIKMDHTMDYSLDSIKAFREELDASLDVIATAAKYDAKAAANELI